MYDIEMIDIESISSKAGAFIGNGAPTFEAIVVAAIEYLKGLGHYYCVPASDFAMIKDYAIKNTVNLAFPNMISGQEYRVLVALEAIYSYLKRQGVEPGYKVERKRFYNKSYEIAEDFGNPLPPNEPESQP